MLALPVLSRVVFERSLASGDGRNEQLCTGIHFSLPRLVLPSHVTPPQQQHHSAIASNTLLSQYLANASKQSSARFLLDSIAWRTTA